MVDLTRPLTDRELDRLERLLLDRVDEDAVTESSDEGVLDVSELDGFCTAVVSGPATLMPSQWLPAVWGDFEPAWRTAKEFQDVFSLLGRHINDIVDRLMSEPEDFEPMYLERVADGKRVLVVDEWCEGYARGVALSSEEWEAAPPEVVDLLTPILAFTEATNWLAHDLDDSKEVDRLRSSIAPNVRAIHAYWLSQRGAAAAAIVPFRRDQPRVGRNDPCPCASGKKHKHCCGS
jgi:uncharacterized protein